MTTRKAIVGIEPRRVEVDSNGQVWIDHILHSDAEVIHLKQERIADDPNVWPVRTRWVGPWEGDTE